MTRRLRAKPEALAARGKLAEGTQPGTELIPEAQQCRDAMGRSALATPELQASTLLRDLDVRTAERDRALALLAQLEHTLTAIGGYMSSADQQWLREARSLLVQFGHRAPENITPWKDRV